MGKSISKKALVILCLTLVCTTPTKAATVEDLYNLYDLPCTVKCPEAATDTINAYQQAEKYNAMYHYIVESEYDSSVLTNRVDMLQKNLDALSDKLLACANADIDTIYELESQYTDCKQKLDEAKLAVNSCDIDYTIPQIGEVPTVKQYHSALSVKEYSNAYKDIGDIETLSYPVDKDAVVYDSDSTHVTIRTVHGAMVKALLSGKVVKCTDTSVTIHCGGNIYVLEDQLAKVFCDVGDTVVQGDIIGKANRYVLLKLKVGGVLCDVNKLFSKGG